MRLFISFSFICVYCLHCQKPAEYTAGPVTVGLPCYAEYTADPVTVGLPSYTEYTAGPVTRPA